jgi:protein-tyrosine kinase
MSRVTDALKRSGLETASPPQALNDGVVDVIQFFVPGQPAVSVPWDLSAESQQSPSPTETKFDVVKPPRTTDGESQHQEWLSHQQAEKLVLSSTVAPIAREEYRRLAALLHQAQFEHGIKVALVTSAVPGEGKTLTVSNLALTLSDSYRRQVLLIDADLRRPALHTVFGVPNTRGLCNAVTSDGPPVLFQPTAHLALLTAGRSHDDPMKTLASDRMRGLIDEARTRFDWVLLDTPPVALLPDAKVLAALADVALIVVLAGRTGYDAIQSAVDGIGRDRIFGVVLNGTAEPELTESYGAYYLSQADR